MKELPSYLKIWKYDATTYAVGIIQIFSVVAFVLFIIAFILVCSCNTSLVFWATFIGSCIAIANAILLYATLMSQNKSIANEREAHKQERFETTFFNLLQVQRKLTDELLVKYGFVDKNGRLSFQEVNSRCFFSFSLNEIQLISKSLKSNVTKKYDWENNELAISAFEKEWESTDPTHVMDDKRQLKWEEFRENIQIQYTNLLYDIRTKDRATYSTNPNWHYKLFIKRWYPVYEHYIRNLYYFLQFVYDENKSDKESLKKYTNFIQSQMSRDELFFVKMHGESFPSFQELLNKTHMTEILTNNNI